MNAVYQNQKKMQCKRERTKIQQQNNSRQILYKKKLSILNPATKMERTQVLRKGKQLLPQQ
jgi:hypothetical protein